MTDKPPEGLSSPEFPNKTTVQLDPELFAKMEMLKGIIEQSDSIDSELSVVLFGYSEPTVENLVNAAVRSYLNGVMSELNKD